jgi:hypothetical protein
MYYTHTHTHTHTAAKLIDIHIVDRIAAASAKREVIMTASVLNMIFRRLIHPLNLHLLGTDYKSLCEV